MNRVVITGIGEVTPIGNDAKTTWDNMLKGVCGIDKITHYDASMMKCSLAAELKDFDGKQYYETVQDFRKTDLNMQYAMAASLECVADSKILESDVDKDRVGVYIGTGIGGINTTINESNKNEQKGPDRVSPFFVPMMIANMATGAVSIRFGFTGPTCPIVTACATSSNTIGEAYRAIKHGYADAILAGGTEAAINRLSMAGFVNCQALCLSDDKDAASIPFDKRRSGFVMGEGGAVMMLEELEHAKKRGAKIYAEVVGYGNTADAYHITAPDPEGKGAIKAIKLAVEEAGITGDENIYVNAHGTSTHLNDLMETKALKEVFGEKAYNLSISSTKSMTGHMLGATGAVEAIAATQALVNGVVPPTINYKEKDEELDLDYTPNVPKERALDFAISTSLGFGGHNACLALKKYN